MVSKKVILMATAGVLGTGYLIALGAKQVVKSVASKHESEDDALWQSLEAHLDDGTDIPDDVELEVLKPTAILFNGVPDSADLTYLAQTVFGDLGFGRLVKINDATYLVSLKDGNRTLKKSY